MTDGLNACGSNDRAASQTSASPQTVTDTRLDSDFLDTSFSGVELEPALYIVNVLLDY